MDLDYCKNIECSEYAIKNTIFCQECLNYISITINPFLKGWISRNQTKKKLKLNILSKTLSPFINGLITRKKIKNTTDNKHLSLLYLTPDKGITKKILKNGNNEFPNNGQLVTVHYIGTLEDGTEFDNSYKRIYPFEFILGNNNVIPLWDMGIKTMSKGEKSILIGTSDYCYQNQELPNIPAGSTLHFEVELIDFKDKPKELFELTPEERTELMLDNKLKAKTLYDNNKIPECIVYYKKAIDSLLDDLHPEKINILCNLAIIYAKLLDWNNSLIYIQKAYEIDNKNIKILYWLAKVYYNLKKYDNAINISKKLNHIDPNNSLSRLIIKDSLSNKKFENEKNKKMYQKMFC
tara:strand:+ start:7822 stop:8871 length:1050 start_codon:yes stop_codon:yes gene_type:complete